MRIKRLGLPVVAILPLFACTSVSAEPAPQARFTLDQLNLPDGRSFAIGLRYGDIQPTSFDLEYSSESDDAETGLGCETFAIPGANGISLMFEGGTLVRIDAYTPYEGEPPMTYDLVLAAQAIPSESDFNPLGQSREEVDAAFDGEIEVSEHPYLGSEGDYLSWFPADPAGRGLIMETYQGSVTSFRVGTAGAVRYIEGCL